MSAFAGRSSPRRQAERRSRIRALLPTVPDDRRGLLHLTVATYRLAVIPGDGVGKEVIPEGLRVLRRAGEVTG